MIRARWLVLGIGALLVAAMAMAGWASVQLGYPGTVYYQRTIVSSTGPSSLPTEQEELWTDPARDVFRYWSRAASGASGFVIRAGLSYPLKNAIGPVGWPLPPEEQETLLRSSRALARGGYAELGRELLARATSAVAHVRFAGRPALRFATAEHSLGISRAVIWLDAHSYEPLQYAYSLPGGVVKTERFVKTARLAPHTLPPIFFDQQSGPSTPWDHLHDWIREHLSPYIT